MGRLVPRLRATGFAVRLAASESTESDKSPFWNSPARRVALHSSNDDPASAFAARPVEPSTTTPKKLERQNPGSELLVDQSPPSQSPRPAPPTLTPNPRLSSEPTPWCKLHHRSTWQVDYCTANGWKTGVWERTGRRAGGENRTTPGRRLWAATEF